MSGQTGNAPKETDLRPFAESVIRAVIMEKAIDLSRPRGI